MSKSRLAVWPLVIAAIFLIAAVASIFYLPTVDPTLTVGGFPVESNKEMITLGLFGFVLIFAALAFLLRKTDKELVTKVAVPKVKKVKNDAATAQMAAVANAYGFNEEEETRKPAGLTPEQRAAQREERKRELEASKFRRAAEKEAKKAEKAAQKAARKGKKADIVEVDELSTIAIVVEELNNGEQVEAENVYEIEAVVEAEPEWLNDAYTDDSFVVPFADQEEPVFEPEAEEPEAVEETVEEVVEEPEVKETTADVIISEDYDIEDEVVEELVEAVILEELVEEIADEIEEEILEEELIEEILEEEKPEPTLAEKMAALFVEAQIQAEKEAEDKYATENVKLREELEELKELLLSTNSKARRANARKHNQHKRKPRGQR